MKTISKSGLKVKASVKAGGIGMNHNRSGLKVRAGVKAGGIGMNHSRSGLKVRTEIRAGLSQLASNHNRRLLTAR